MSKASNAHAVQVALPMCLFCQIVTPQQTATYKLTLDTNRPPPQLADLFQDMVAQAQAGHYSVKSKQLPPQYQHGHVHRFVQHCSQPNVSPLTMCAASGYAVSVCHVLPGRMHCSVRSVRTTCLGPST